MEVDSTQTKDTTATTPNDSKTNTQIAALTTPRNESDNDTQAPPVRVTAAEIKRVMTSIQYDHAKSTGLVHALHLAERHEKGELTTDEFLVSKLFEDGPIFVSSCHREFVYFGHTKSLTALLLSLGVIIAQTVLYSVFLVEAFKKIAEDHVNVEVSWDACINYNILSESNMTDISSFGLLNETISLVPSLACEADEPNNPGVASVLPAILLSAYTMGDLVNGVKAFFLIEGRWSKMAAIILIMQNIFAVFTGIMWAFVGYWAGSSYDSIVNCVGVLFVHEIDEKVSETLLSLQKQHMTCKFCTQTMKKYIRLAVPFGILVATYIFTLLVILWSVSVLEK